MLEISPLTNDPGVVQQLVEWNVRYWSDKVAHVTDEEWHSFFRDSLTSAPDALPTTLVGSTNSEVFGSVSLVEVDDVEEYPNYRPWVAALFVEESQRGQGRGDFLLAAIVDVARTMNFSSLYLWTEAQAPWYERRGWRVIHSVEVRGTAASILTFEL